MKTIISRKGKPPRSPKLLGDELKAIFEEELQEVQREFESTVATWEKKPEFEIKRQGVGSASISTQDEIFNYVNEGTRAHEITPKRPGYPLRFNTSGFRAKTAVRQLGSEPGNPAKPPTARTMRVWHPGTTARDFDLVIKARSEARLKRKIDAKLREYGKES